MVNNKPIVSVGMPVYNGEKFIRKAIESILNQSFQNFELIISDNASTDSTSKICQDLASRDSRIRFIRQVENIGALKNFEFVYRESVGLYFMWAAADDYRSVDFLEKNLDFLECNKDFVASTSPVRFENGNFNHFQMGCFNLDMNSCSERIAKFYTGWHANGRYYSLLKRAALEDFPFPEWNILGGDWYLVLFLASKGKLNCIAEGEAVLGSSGVSNTTNIFIAYNTSVLNFLFPFNKLFIRTEKLISRMNLFDRLSMYRSWTKLSYHALKLNLKWKFFPRQK